MLKSDKRTFARKFPWLHVAGALLLLILIIWFIVQGHGKSHKSVSENDGSETELPATALNDTVLKDIRSIAYSEQRVGDPELGKHYLLDAPYVDCGLPLSLVQRQSNQEWPDPELLLIDRQGQGAELPYFNNLVQDSTGQQLVTNNCLTCHAAPLFGNIVVGLGNEFLDFTADASRQLERVGLLIASKQEEQAWRRLADRIQAVAPYTTAHTTGVNVANNLTFALMTHRDPHTLAWSDTPLMQPPDTEPLPVSVPPWWRMKKKHAMFYQGQARGDHARFMMTASILCADGLAEVKKTDDYAAHIRAYIASLVPPVYPFPIDRPLAGKGQRIFEGQCASCHGRYEAPDSYPNLVIPLAVIGTDPALAVQAAVDYQRYAVWSAESFFTASAEIVPLQGYMPPPLDGVWATAPFLHNGSVPSIAALLDSSSRPEYWRHAEQRIYDQSALGWTFERLLKGKDPAGTHEQNKHIYDTSLRGYGNAGHLFGDALGTEQRQAVLEYLKTL